MPSTEKATQTRAERVEEYVMRDAWADVLCELSQAIKGSRHLIESDDLVFVLGSEATSPLLDELWPEPADPTAESTYLNDPEFEAATTRAIALQASILMRLTTAEVQDELRVEAARLAEIASKRQAVA